MRNYLYIPAIALIAYLFGAFSALHHLFPLPELYKMKTFVFASSEPPSRYTFDDEERLASDETKVPVDCPRQGDRAAVLLVLGQSNAANYAGQRFSSSHGANVLNFYGGRCYVAASPLLGSSGTKGEYWTLLGNLLIESGKFDQVIIAPIALSGSEIARWASGGDLNAAMTGTITQLRQSGYRITHVLWHQGEIDYVLNTDEEDYRLAFRSIVETLRKLNVGVPIYISIASKCLEPSNGGKKFHEPDNPVTRAQSALPASMPGLLTGVNTDALLDDGDRYDDCHFSASGSQKVANAWMTILMRDQWRDGQFEQKRPAVTSTVGVFSGADGKD